MDNQQLPESGYRITNLLLVETHFQRTPSVTFDPQKVKSLADISVNTVVNEGEIIVTETLNYQQVVEGITEVSAIITMVGVFEQTGEHSTLPPIQFGDTNGAAIIFPFIREQLASLALKAGIGSVLLPPASFVHS